MKDLNIKIDNINPKMASGIWEICGEEKTTKTQAEIDAAFTKYFGILNEKKAFFDKVSSEDWRRVSNSLDTYLQLKYHVKEAYNMHVSTNASLKMYELMSSKKLIKAGQPINVFCNAELPGAFISAINHYAVNNAMPLNWVASSYYPADITASDSILEDQYGIYINNKNKWLMGTREDGSYVSGDVRDVDVITQLAKDAEAKLGVRPNLYTSDAGIDCSSAYNKQEEMTMSINFGQILCGLLSIGDKGTIVTKQYTFFNKFNRALIFELYKLFDQFYVVKPLTSRPLNSEVYLVGIGYRREFAETRFDLLKSILKVLDTQSVEESANMLEAPPIDFDNHLLTITEIIYVDQQFPYLDRAKKIYTTKEFVKKNQEWKKWLQITGIKPITDKDILPSNFIQK